MGAGVDGTANGDGWWGVGSDGVCMAAGVAMLNPDMAMTGQMNLSKG